ncbi:hypothetical protein [Undibacterium sp. TJN19]|uniref:hypothetical protein n=1 Tax=Undibacterium sp. TJN19 TaxID=3413055 RepID=UPI003BF0B6D0
MIKEDSQNEAVSEELTLLRNINTKVDAIDGKVAGMKRQAIIYGTTAGAAAGGLSGAIVAAGILTARIKLGL